MTNYEAGVANGRAAAHMSAEQPAASKELASILRELAVRAVAVGPKDVNITLAEVLAVSKAAELMCGRCKNDLS